MPIDRIDEEIIYDIDINAIEQALLQTGWVSGWAVTGNGAALSVDVASGAGESEGTAKTTGSSTNVVLTAAHATKPRKDLIVYDKSGSVIAKVDGTAAVLNPVGETNPRKMTSPAPPDLGATDDILIAVVYVPAAVTLGSECTIIDKRVAIPQGYDATLESIAALGTAANKMLYTTDVDTWAEAALTAFARSVLDDADEATFKATVNLEIGTDVQAYDAELAALAGLTSAANKLPYFTGSGAASLADLSAFGRTLIDDAAAVNARTTLELVIGTHVLAYDAGLSNLAGIAMIADKFYYTSADNVHVAGAVTAFARSILDDANEATFKATVNLEDADINTLIQATKLDDLTAPDDTTDLDATASLHGLMSKAAMGKLDGIAAGATLYPDTGEQAFLDADHSKLDAIEALADVTDATNVAAAGALMVADLENPPTEDETDKSPTSEWAFDHDAATTGVHGAGGDTLATDANIATHAAIKAANATLGHVIVETASKIDVDGNGKLTLGSDVLLEADLENPPTEDEAAKAPTSEWAFDHDADVDAHHDRSKIVDPTDQDTLVEVEEDQVTMDVAGVEAFLLNTAGIPTWAKQALISAYAGSDQTIPTGAWTKLLVDTEEYDIQNEMNVTKKTGTADGNVLNHLQDDGNSQFAASDVGATVWTNKGGVHRYAVITVFNDTGDVTLDSDAAPDGDEDYILYHARYTTTVDGKYIILIAIQIKALDDQKYVAATLYKNGVILKSIAVYCSLTGAWPVACLVIKADLAATDYLDFYTYHDHGANRDLRGGQAYTYVAVSKIA